MSIEFTIISSSGSVCIYRDNQYFFRDKTYDQIWHAKIDGFTLDENYPFYLIKWEYQNQNICIRVEDDVLGFVFDKNSQLIVCCAEHRLVIFNNHKKDNMVLTPTQHMGGKWFFLKLNGDFDHHAVIPKFVFIKKDEYGTSIPYLPKNKLEEVFCIKTDVEMFTGFGMTLGAKYLRGTFLYHYDWYQERAYDPINRQWGDILGNGRL